MFKKNRHLLSLIIFSSPVTLAGNLNPPAGSTDPASAMYNIQDICNRLDSGAAGSKQAFTEPTSGPADSSRCTLNDIMDKSPAVDETNGATPAEVLNGKTFWGLNSGNWGPQTGIYAGGGSAAIAETGQTTCYDESGTAISCSNTGQDGDKQMGVTWPNLRFTDNGNGTVTDNLTNLIWLKNANCINTEYSEFDGKETTDKNDIVGDGQVTWQKALEFVTGINNDTYADCGASKKDWRLPNIKELHSLIDVSQKNPALPAEHPFTGVQASHYWSSTTNIDIPNKGWSVKFDYGSVTAYPVKTNGNYVWPVRGGV